ncbi:hypothetical protein JG687_00004495 [Phytophthora cactorum]|uniref:Integrase catalytic domain-containing protein n=1 Tax=Phytophthora cactorum TaxID=29920 RepID=A0A8T1DIG2_9STRA|nr:hypothetical protein Pcac1_g11562 [Phytophthora cactorum]KAG2905665.1 hypothetical protein PC114_g11444 [Phytophthora cactorum]KAG2938822.1 hypothetical protein PC117_g11085 [Phytophthora cactorum]KAG3018059.1 hypothetical protein PC119_g10786 [Phytophthora cactorum]KAG3019681.1 hypothetical protein PC120_g9737 [Phytophthora cactorum]
MFLGDGFDGSRYLLVLKDSLTHYGNLFPCSSPTAYVAADAPVTWYKRYGCPKILISDQGSHFRNEIAVDNLCARLKIERQCSPVYSPWLNGTVERLNKDFLQVFRALLLEYKLDAVGSDIDCLVKLLSPSAVNAGSRHVARRASLQDPGWCCCCRRWRRCQAATGNVAGLDRGCRFKPCFVLPSGEQGVPWAA